MATEDWSATHAPNTLHFDATRLIPQELPEALMRGNVRVVWPFDLFHFDYRTSHLDPHGHLFNKGWLQQFTRSA